MNPGQPRSPFGGAFPQPATQPLNSQSGGMSGSPFGGAAGNQAADLINRILTNPRPGGAAGMGVPGGALGTGIAGVATKASGEGIKIYAEKSKYKEWEFLYDPRQDKSGQIAQSGSGNMRGIGGPQNPNQPVGPGPSPFGGSPTSPFGGSNTNTPFGATPTR